MSGNSLPLSTSQGRAWGYYTDGAAQEAYNLPITCRIDGPLDPHRLQGALDDVVALQSTLRSRFFVDAGGEPAQRAERRVVPVERVVAADADRAFRAAALQPMCLEDGPPLRAVLALDGDVAWRLRVVVHHIACDLPALGLLLEQLVEAYERRATESPAKLDPLPHEYGDWVREERRWLESAEGLRQRRAQVARLAHPPPLSSVPSRHPRPERPERQRFVGGEAAIPVDDALIQAVRDSGRTMRATRFIMWSAAYVAALAAAGAGNDVIWATPLSGRPLEGYDRVVGSFANRGLMRCAVDPATTLQDVVVQVRRQLAAALEARYVPPELVLEDLGLVPQLDLNPLAQTLFTVEAPFAVTHSNPERWMVLPPPIDAEEGPIRDDLRISLRPFPRSGQLVVEWAADLGRRRGPHRRRRCSLG